MTLVRLDVEGTLGEIVLDRPRQLNAMTPELVSELLDRIAEAERAGLRALLFRAEGRAFSAGRDIAGAQPGVEDGGQVLADVFNPMVRRVADLEVPTCAAVQGACLGTGLGLALACDVVFAAHDAKIGSPFAQIGAVLDSGAHAGFVSRIGPHRTLELVYSGRLLSGREAAEWGLVNRSVDGGDLLSETRAFARAVAGGPTAAFVESKRIVRRLTDDTLSLTDVLDAEAAAQSRASRTSDYVEGFTAFLDKRTPTFHGR
jgi:enoyl-CoA hydratase/carnithine racemase